VRDRLVKRDAAKPPPRDRVADLLAEGLVAELVAVLQIQQPQQGRDRDRRAAQPDVEVRTPGRQEALIVEVGVDVGELIG